MRTYTYEQIIQERKREYLELMKEIQTLKQYITKTKYADSYELKYVGYLATWEPNLVILVDKHYNLLTKEVKKLMDKLGISILGGNIFRPNQELLSAYYIGKKKVIQIHDVENFKGDMEKILNSELALELKRYDYDGIVENYSLNDYLLVHTSNSSKVTNGITQLTHDYFPETLLFNSKNGIVTEKKALHFFKEEYSSFLFSDYFRYHIDGQETLEYQFDDCLKDVNLNWEVLTGKVSQGKVLIRKK